MGDSFPWRKSKNSYKKILLENEPELQRRFTEMKRNSIRNTKKFHRTYPVRELFFLYIDDFRLAPVSASVKCNLIADELF